MPTLTEKIKELLPKENDQGVYFKDSRNADEVSCGIGYNYCLQDVHSKLPEILKLIQEEVASMTRKKKPTHGTCCTCQDCGYGHDDYECECPRNRTIEEVLELLK